MPTPVLTHNQLGWAYLTGVVNEIKPTASFLKRLYFGGREMTVPTESIELSYRIGKRQLAPFVEVNSEAIPVGGRDVKFANVSAPNIKIKRPMEAYNVLLRRQPGTSIHIDGGAVTAAYRAAIAEDAEIMADLIDNREEWMVAQMLTNSSISYKVEDGANFKITFPRDNANTVTLTTNGSTGTAWDESGRNIPNDFMTAKRTMAKAGFQPTVCVMGTNAAGAFLADSTVQQLLDRRNIDAGMLELQNQFTDQVAIYLGRFMGVPVWEYSQQYIDTDGSTAVSYLGVEHVLFLDTGPRNEGVIYYGAIPDHDAFEQGLLQARRFSKSWVVPDPSVRVQLVQSRPLPALRRPDSTYLLDVNLT